MEIQKTINDALKLFVKHEEYEMSYDVHTETHKPLFKGNTTIKTKITITLTKTIENE